MPKPSCQDRLLQLYFPQERWKKHTNALDRIVDAQSSSIKSGRNATLVCF